MASAVITTPDGQKIKLGIPEGATQEQIAAKIAQVKADFLSSTTSTPTTESDPLNRELRRPGAVTAGATIGGTAGGLAGATGGPVAPATVAGGAVLGAGLGGGMGGAAFDLAESVARYPARQQAAAAREALGRSEPESDLMATLDADAHRKAGDIAWSAGAEMGGQSLVPAALRISETRAARALMDKIRKQDLSDMLGKAQSGFQRTVGQLKAEEGQAFDVLEQAAGEAGPTLNNFRKGLLDNIPRMGDSPMGAAMAVRRSGQVGAPNEQAVFDELTKAFPDLDAEQIAKKAAGLIALRLPTNAIKELTKQAPAAIDVMVEGQHVPLWVARQAQAQLRAMGGSNAMASPRQGQYRHLAGELEKDIAAWVDAPDTPDLGPGLAAAKAGWREFKGRLHRVLPKAAGNSRFSLMEGGATVTEESALENIFTPGQVQITRNFYELVPEAERVQWASTFLRDMADKSTVNGRVSPIALRRNLGAYDRRGHLDVIVKPLEDAGLLPGGAVALRRGARDTMNHVLESFSGTQGVGFGAAVGAAGGQYTGSDPVVGGLLGAGIPALAGVAQTGPGQALMQGMRSAAELPVMAAGTPGPVPDFIRRALLQLMAQEGRDLTDPMVRDLSAP